MEFNLQKLRYERMSRKVSQDRMAKELGITRTTYFKKENGNIRISVEEFSKILSVLNIPHEEVGIFFGYSVPKGEQKAT